MYSSKTAALNLIHELCKIRPQHSLDAFMALIVGVMNAFQAAGPNASVEQTRRMDGAFLAIGNLADVLKKKVCVHMEFPCLPEGIDEDGLCCDYLNFEHGALSPSYMRSWLWAA